MSQAANTTNFRQSLGRMGEDLAEAYLRNLGWTIVERNYFAHRLGEIDIIAQPPAERLLVFIEVKTRDIKAQAQVNGLDHSGQLAVDRRKQKRLIRAAMAYLRARPSGWGLRFDVLLVDVQRSQALPDIVRAGDLEGLNNVSKIIHLQDIVGSF